MPACSAAAISCASGGDGRRRACHRRRQPTRRRVPHPTTSIEGEVEEDRTATRDAARRGVASNTIVPRRIGDLVADFVIDERDGMCREPERARAPKTTLVRFHGVAPYSGRSLNGLQVAEPDTESSASRGECIPSDLRGEDALAPLKRLRRVRGPMVVRLRGGDGVDLEPVRRGRPAAHRSRRGRCCGDVGVHRVPMHPYRRDWQPLLGRISEDRWRGPSSWVCITPTASTGGPRGMTVLRRVDLGLPARVRCRMRDRHIVAER